MSPDGDTAAPDAYRVFRPVRARRVASGVAVLSVVVLGAVAVALPGEGLLWDRIGIAAVGVAVAWFMSRQAGVRAEPSGDGLLVRNLLLQRRLEWPEVVTVRFGADRAWVQLDLSDGDTLSVMAIQRSDGAYAEREAKRLATLVARHTRTERDD